MTNVPGDGSTPSEQPAAEPAPPAYQPPAAPAAQPPAYAAAPQTPAAPQPPAYTAAPPAYGAPAAPQNPGRTLGIVAFIVAFFFNVIGLILGIVAMVQSRKVGQSNGFALAAIIIGAVSIVIGIIVAIAFIAALGAACANGACSTSY